VSSGVSEDKTRDEYRDALAWIVCCLDADGPGASAVRRNADAVMVSGALAQLLIDQVEARGIDVREWIAERQADDRAALAAGKG
jgi:hypothetical protein